MYSDNLRSSAWAQTGKLQQQILRQAQLQLLGAFFSHDVRSKKPAAADQGRGGVRSPGGGRRRREKRAIEVGISGRLFRTVDRRRKLIGYKFADLHPQRRNGIAPLVNRLHARRAQSPAQPRFRIE